MKISNSSPVSTAAPWVLFSLYQLEQGNKLWALKTMGRSAEKLKKEKEMPFGLMLGTGSGNGFSMYPDWSRYALCSSWASPDAAQKFLATSLLAKRLAERSSEVWSVLMQPVVSRGAWGGRNPFTPQAAPLAPSEPVVALTRARIRFSRLPEFWKYVPGVSDATGRAPGLLAKTGIGQLPLVEQATLSVWENAAAIDEFAYKMQQHRQVVGLTRQRNWYSEELFARFRPVWINGSWSGSPLLPQLIATPPQI